MFSWGKKPQAQAGSSDDAAYKPLIVTEITDTSVEDSTASPRPSSADQAQLVKQWLLSCNIQEGTEVLEAIALQRPELVRGPVVMEVARREDRNAEQTQKGDTVIEIQPSVSSAAPPRQEARLLPMLQFSTSKYYCKEDEPTVEVQVLRLNGSDLRSQVSYSTADKTAVKGVNYVEASGLLIFEPGERSKSIRIELIDDSAWGGVLEFSVNLEEKDLSNAVLSEHISSARIQRIDDDTFPTNRFKEQILSRKVDEINSVSLFIEYFKLCLSDPVIRSGTIKTIIIGQVKNVFALLGLFANIYLVDHVLASTKPGDDPDNYLLVNKQWSLVAYIFSSLVPLALFHAADYSKFSWRVGGKARTSLSSGLVNSFLYLDDTCQGEVDEGALQEVMTHDTEALIKVGYNNFVNLFALLGQIFLFILFQVGVPLISGSSRASIVILQMALFPVMIAVVLSLRLRVTRQTLNDRRDSDRAMTRHIHEMLANVSLLKDYSLRGTAMDRHADFLKKINAADKAVGETLNNNAYLMKWLTFVAVSIYVLNGGMAVINGDLRLGLYLTMTKVFMTLGKKWSAVYTTLLSIFNSVPALERIVNFINLPTDTQRHMQIVRSTQNRTSTLFDRTGAADSSSCSNFNVLPIELVNLAVTLCTVTRQGDNRIETTLLFDELVIEQGKLVSLVGRRGAGKSTLLKILGGASLPDTSTFEDVLPSRLSIPPHLRVLHVAHEPMFLRGGLYENLTYGVQPGRPDASVERVKEVCKRLDLPNKLIEAIDPNSKDEFSWSSALSSSEQSLLCIARALIANPEVLCIHKPTLHVNEKTAKVIINLLREFVDNRGIAQDGVLKFRRPRTCFFTSTRALSLSSADAVFRVSPQCIVKVDISTIALDDLC